MASTLQITFNTTGQDQAERLIAELSELEFYAFETENNILKAYIIENKIERVALLKIAEAYNIPFEEKIIEEKNWNEKWESEFEPIIIDKYVAIRADFHAPISGIQYDIIITPKMSFGTGHHPTTYLMVKAMQNFNFPGKRVLDFGTGTGVLAIVAALSGSEVVAVDYDEWSITNTKENIAKNQCKNIDIIQGDEPPANIFFDIILANINTHVLLNNLGAMGKICNLSGHLLISGFLEKDVKRLTESFSGVGFLLEHSLEKEGWYCLLFKKESI